MAPLLHRRELLRLIGAGLVAGVGAACGTGRGDDRSVPADPAVRRRLHAGGRLIHRPRAPRPGAPPSGLHPLRLSGSDRDGIVYVPPSYRHEVPAPLVLSLHGAGGSGRRGLRRVQPLADAAGLILLVPDSRAGTWDLVRTGIFGPDVEYLDQALDLVFSRYAVDPGRVVAEGFSDGASYALSMGLLNGDLFTHVIAFSPGFVTKGSRRGRPRLFVSHGVHDQVLPIELCGRRIARELRGDDYDVRYAEFEGGHAVPDEIARAALEWLAGSA
jgi:phospholipase/carboxylesterase